VSPLRCIMSNELDFPTDEDMARASDVFTEGDPDSKVREAKSRGPRDFEPVSLFADRLTKVNDIVLLYYFTEFRCKGHWPKLRNLRTLVRLNLRPLYKKSYHKGHPSHVKWYSNHRILFIVCRTNVSLLVIGWL
jgi:hypothetical protein